MHHKPAALIYGANDQVPWYMLLVIGLQHTIAMSSTLILPGLLIAALQGSLAQGLLLTQASMFAIGIGSILMGLKNRYIGSGFLCPLLLEPSAYSVSMLAVKLGGLPLLYGINILISVLQLLFGAFIQQLQRVLAIEVTGVVVLMIGVTLITPGIEQALNLSDVHQLQWHGHAVIVSTLTLLVMLGISVWGKKSFSAYSLFIGVIFGCLLSVILGDFHFTAFVPAPGTKVIAIPHVVPFSKISIQWGVIVPVIIAALSCSLKGIGNLTTCQKINDIGWIRTDMTNIRKGLVTNGLSSLMSSLLGGLPTATSSSNVGLSIATKVASRYIAISAGIIFFILSLIPSLCMVFVNLPNPVKGAVILYVTSFVIISGIQIMMSRMMDMRKIFTIGIPIMIGLGFEFIPGLVTEMPASVQPFFSSPLTTATIIAIALNMLFKINLSEKATLHLNLQQPFSEKIWVFLQEQGATWGALSHTIRKATEALNEALEAIPVDEANANVEICVTYNEYSLTIELLYQGETIDLNLGKPSKEQVITNAAAAKQLAVYILKQKVDRLTAHHSGKGSLLKLVINQ